MRVVQQALRKLPRKMNMSFLGKCDMEINHWMISTTKPLYFDTINSHNVTSSVE